MAEPISETEMERARRATSRRLAAAMLTCMAETDTDFTTINLRLGGTPDNVAFVWNKFCGFAKGNPDEGGNLRFISNFFLAMGAELNIYFTNKKHDDEEKSKTSSEQKAV